MGKRIFLAGAGGAIGRRLVPLLVADGHHVTGTTRSAAKAGALHAAGIAPVVVDVFDAEALRAAVIAAAPEIVIHQLTDLPAKLDPALMEQAIGRNARIREIGTAHLMAAAKAAGARRMIAQSIAFAYAPADTHPTALIPAALNAMSGPLDETHPLDFAGAKLRLVTVNGVAALEQAVLGAPGITGIVLRYGRLYGPGTGAEAPPTPSPVHVDAAAKAAALAVTHGAAGIYNIAEDDGTVTSEKAKRDLGWSSAFRLP